MVRYSNDDKLNKSSSLLYDKKKSTVYTVPN